MIFVDTGALLARRLEGDQFHVKSVRAWLEIERAGVNCFTSTLVLSEFFTLLARKASYGLAAQEARKLLASQVCEVLRPGPEDDRRALEVFEKFADQKLSFTGSMSIALMRQRRIRRIFTFDSDFAHAGLDVWPRLATR